MKKGGGGKREAGSERGKRRIRVFPTGAYARGAAEVLAGIVADSVARRGTCSVALAGGKTPVPVYRELATPPLAGTIRWDRVRVFFGDERAVPQDHPESNYRLARDALLAHVPVRAGDLHPMDAAGPDRDAAAAAYGGALPARLDLLILGAGPDGHTASLFPGSPALTERERRVVPVIGPKPPPARLTITPPVIEAADEIVVLVNGPDKAGVVAQALEGPWDPTALPVQLARRGLWLLDEPAAGGLTRPPAVR